jgi:hypothetical protein
MDPAHVGKDQDRPQAITENYGTTKLVEEARHTLENLTTGFQAYIIRGYPNPTATAAEGRTLRQLLCFGYRTFRSILFVISVDHFSNVVPTLSMSSGRT